MFIQPKSLSLLLQCFSTKTSLSCVTKLGWFWSSRESVASRSGLSQCSVIKCHGAGSRTRGTEGSGDLRRRHGRPLRASVTSVELSVCLSGLGRRRGAARSRCRCQSAPDAAPGRPTGRAARTGQRRRPKLTDPGHGERNIQRIRHTWDKEYLWPLKTEENSPADSEQAKDISGSIPE